MENSRALFAYLLGLITGVAGLFAYNEKIAPLLNFREVTRIEKRVVFKEETIPKKVTYRVTEEKDGAEAYRHCVIRIYSPSGKLEKEITDNGDDIIGNCSEDKYIEVSDKGNMEWGFARVTDSKARKFYILDKDPISEKVFELSRIKLKQATEINAEVKTALKEDL